MRSRNPGVKNRRISLKAPQVVNTLGDVVTTFQEVATVWADERPMRMDERFTSDARHSMRVSNFRIWYRSDVTPEMVIAYAGRDWRITGIAEIGLREELELTAEAVY
jgi:SPP1 family predicted phage head-tail adaptor